MPVGKGQGCGVRINPLPLAVRPAALNRLFQLNKDLEMKDASGIRRRGVKSIDPDPEGSFSGFNGRLAD